MSHFSFPRIALTTLASGLLAATLPAHAVDVDAGDYTALPDGTNLAMVYYQYATRDTAYSNGSSQPGRPGLDSHVGILRGVHFMNIGGYTVDPQFLLPFGRMETSKDMSAVDNADGVGDLILAATVWLLNDKEQGRYFGITPFLYAPTGSYDHNDALNLGENRWKFALQAGYITPIVDKWLLDVTADVTLFGNNDKFGANRDTMKQEAMFQLQSFVRYQIDPTLDLRVGLSQTFGGETKVAGVKQDDEGEVTKMSVGTAWSFAPGMQLLATYGQDLRVENGLKEKHRLNLRFLKAF